MEFSQSFAELAQSEVKKEALRRKEDGWRYVQMLAVNVSEEGFEGVDLIYSYMKDGALENLVVKRVPRNSVVDSISDAYLAAFVWENEVHDLFGISFEGIAIDFLGSFYRVSTEYPMTIISPEQLARREKERKAAEAKARKAAEKEAPSAASEAADMEAKLAGMDPEKAAKVRAAMEAKARKAAAKKEGE